MQQEEKGSKIIIPPFSPRTQFDSKGFAPPNFKYYFPNDLWYIQLISSSSNELLYENKLVKCFLLGYSAGFSIEQNVKFETRHYFAYLLFMDNTSQAFFNIVPDEKLINQIKKPLKNYLSRGRIGAFSHRRPVPIVWETQSNDEVYVEANQHYDKARAVITRCIMSEVLKGKKSGLIIDAGCGKGLLASELDSEIKPETELKLSYTGFDFNEKNYKQCQELQIKNFSCHFLKEKFQNIQAIFEFTKVNLDINTISLIVFSGTLTRGVLDGFEVLEILQATAKNNIYYVIVCGFEQVIPNEFIFGQLGYNNAWSAERHGHFCLYNKLSAEEIFSRLSKKLTEQKILDLSLSYQPDYYLNLFAKEIQNDITIDLSFCVISTQLISTLKEILKIYDLKIIFWHHNYAALCAFQDEFGLFSEYAGKVYIKLIEGYKDDYFLMGPRNFFSTVQTEHPIAIKTKYFLPVTDDKYTTSAINLLEIKQEQLSDRIHMNKPLSTQSTQIYLTKECVFYQKAAAHFSQFEYLDNLYMLSFIKLVEFTKELIFIDKPNFLKNKLETVMASIDILLAELKAEQIDQIPMICKRFYNEVSAFNRIHTFLNSTVKLYPSLQKLTYYVNLHNAIYKFSKEQLNRESKEIPSLETFFSEATECLQNLQVVEDLIDKIAACISNLPKSLAPQIEPYLRRKLQELVENFTAVFDSPEKEPVPNIKIYPSYIDLLARYAQITQLNNIMFTIFYNDELMKSSQDLQQQIKSTYRDIINETILISILEEKVQGLVKETLKRLENSKTVIADQLSIDTSDLASYFDDTGEEEEPTLEAVNLPVNIVLSSSDTSSTSSDSSTLLSSQLLGDFSFSSSGSQLFNSSSENIHSSASSSTKTSTFS